jgi:hypothetical protein
VRLTVAVEQVAALLPWLLEGGPPTASAPRLLRGSFVSRECATCSPEPVRRRARAGLPHSRRCPLCIGACAVDELLDAGSARPCAGAGTGCRTRRRAATWLTTQASGRPAAWVSGLAVGEPRR